ncbi:MAG TPA: hypothetical protein DHW34_02150 [Actinobacteria bacterium]|nr:hypothetical protein [Actinomycetota bacterium]
MAHRPRACEAASVFDLDSPKVSAALLARGALVIDESVIDNEHSTVAEREHRLKEAGYFFCFAITLSAIFL